MKDSFGTRHKLVVFDGLAPKPGSHTVLVQYLYDTSKNTARNTAPSQLSLVFGGAMIVPGKIRSNPQDLVEENYCCISRTIFSFIQRKGEKCLIILLWVFHSGVLICKCRG